MPTDAVSVIASAMGEIESAGSEEQLCASFKLSGQETPWIQVVAGILNLWWPFDDDPASRLSPLLGGRLPGLELGDWEAGAFATFDFVMQPAQELAQVVDSLFRELYGCPPDYELDVEVFVVEDAEIPEMIPIRREAGYHTDQIGRFRGGQFMGFVVASLPSLLPDDWPRHKRWYAVVHKFDAEGGYLGSDHWFAGTTADGEQQVVERAQQRLAEMLEQLEDKEYGDIQIGLFSTNIDGREFGLVDATQEDEETGEIYVQAELLPNQLVFFEPWDGTYDT